MTKKLYMTDPYRKEFEAKVISSNEDEVILDQTCFYPLSGGQPADRGYLNGKKVLDAYKDGEDIVHVVEGNIEETKVKGTIDWQRRFEHMQQHTGQHILSRSFIELFGENARSTSLHIGESHNTIDVVGEYTAEDIERVENLSNTVVFENRKVHTYTAPRDDIAERLRKVPEGIAQLRVVEIDNFDLTACGGTHLHTTGETGIIKITNFRKKGEFTRVEFVCGWRALRDYSNRLHTFKEAVNLLNSTAIAEEIKKILEERESLKKELREKEEKLTTYEIPEIIQNAEKVGDYKLIMEIYEDRDIENLIKKFDRENLIVFLADRKTNMVAGFSKVETIDIGEVMKKIGGFLEGGGGGSEHMGKAGGTNPDGIDKAFRFIKEKMKEIDN